jgi:hypothetical protein
MRRLTKIEKENVLRKVEWVRTHPEWDFDMTTIKEL